jgi:L-threonylcarbamoyladenylate synthase
MRELIRRCAFPIAAPSANPANQLSPSDASHVLRGLSGKIPLIVDAGPANVGIESTVVDLTSNPPRILRPGMLSREQIKQVLGVHVESAAESGGVLKSPGLMGRHYSPRAPLRVERWAGDEELERIAKASDVPLEKIHVLAHERIPHRGGYGRIAVIPHDPEAFARALYAELHRCDEMEASLILVEAPPSGPAWEGIQDRLKRASAPV